MKVTFDVEKREDIVPIVEALLDKHKHFQEKSRELAWQADIARSTPGYRGMLPGELMVRSSENYRKAVDILNITEQIAQQYAGGNENE